MEHANPSPRNGVHRGRASWWRPAFASLAAVTLAAGLTGGAQVAHAGAPQTAAAAPAANIESELSAELADGEERSFLVLLDEQADLSGAAEIDDWETRGEQVVSTLRRTAERSQNEIRSMLDQEGVEYEPYWIVNALKVTGGEDLAEELALRDDVDQLLADDEVPLVAPTERTEAGDSAPTDPSTQSVEWGVERVNAPDVWDSHDVRGEGLVVGVIDTGAMYDHEALVDQYRGNLGDGEFSHAYHWHDPTDYCGAPSEAPCDSEGHGTHVTGTVLGDDGGDNQVGVAPQAQWISAMGCQGRGCATSALLSSGEFMLAPTDLEGENPRPELRPHVVNNSWGGDDLDDPWYRGIVESWVAAGVFPQFAAGNTPTGASCASASNPGNLPESYAAGSFDSNNTLADSSNRGPSAWGDGELIKPNISAPGVQIRSSYANGGYAIASGTSMASPHVAGAVALLWSAAPQLEGDVEATRELLDETAIDTEDLTCGGEPGNNNMYGEGRLDVSAAVAQAPREGDSGTLTGTVTDADTDAPLDDALLTVQGDISRTAHTGDEGVYEVALPEGSYDVAASADGYLTETAEGVEITAGETSTVDFPLAVDPDAEAPEIGVEPGEVSSVQEPGEVVTRELTVSNSGDADLHWEIPESGQAPAAGAASVPSSPSSVGGGESLGVGASGGGSLSGDRSLLGGVFGAPEVASPDVSGPAQGQVTLSHSESQTVVSGNSVACSPDNGASTSANGFLRAFALEDFDISGGFEVSEVSFGVELSRDVPHELTVNVFELPSGAELTYGNMERVGSSVVTVDPVELSSVSVPVSGSVSAGATLVAEVAAPDLSGSGAFFLGSNAEGQSAPSYLRAEECGLPEPTDAASVGAPDMHMVLEVTGSADGSGASCGVPGAVDWASVDPVSGVVSPGGAQVVEVSLDSSGLVDGDVVEGQLCVASDDPDVGVVTVPVSLEVEETAVPEVSVSPESVSGEASAGESVARVLEVGNTGDAALDWEITEPEPDSERMALLQDGVLLIPDSSNDRVMAFDPDSGDLVHEDFLPEAPDGDVATPVHVLADPEHERLLVSDQLSDVVHAYGVDGSYLGVHAPAGGADSEIIDNIRGMAWSPAGTLLVTTASGDNENAVVEFDADGEVVGNFIDNEAGGLDGPWDVVFRDDDMLVSASGSSAVHRFTPEGAPDGTFYEGLRFPQQMQQLPDGNVLVSQFSSGGQPGVHEFTADGELVDVYTGISGNRGVFALPNDHILATNGEGVHEIDRDGGVVETKVETSSRFVTHVEWPTSSCVAPSDVGWLSVDPVSGSTAPGAVDEVSVTLDAADLEPGAYEALLCVSSNDPDASLVEVPVSFEVSQAPGLVCDETVSDVHDGPLTVAEGTTTCLTAGAQVLGEVLVQQDASLVGSAAVVQGPVQALGAASVDLQYSQVTGPVLVAGASQQVSLFANQVTGGVTVSDGATVSAPVVSGNTVIGTLACTGNDPAPVDQGLVNTATAKVGQCADL